MSLSHLTRKREDRYPHRLECQQSYWRLPHPAQKVALGGWIGLASILPWERWWSLTQREDCPDSLLCMFLFPQPAKRVELSYPVYYYPVKKDDGPCPRIFVRRPVTPSGVRSLVTINSEPQFAFAGVTERELWTVLRLQQLPCSFSTSLVSTILSISLKTPALYPTASEVCIVIGLHSMGTNGRGLSFLVEDDIVHFEAQDVSLTGVEAVTGRVSGRDCLLNQLITCSSFEDDIL